MTDYHVLLELRGGVGTPLAADTLWGHIAWGIRYRAGEAALLDWLDAHDGASPPLILSDPFPAGYWPRPVLPRSPRPATPPTREQAQQHKQLERRSWVPHVVWELLAGNLTELMLARGLIGQPVPPSSVTVEMLHAGVNRLTGGTAHSDGGTLFTLDQTYYAEPVQFDVWCRSPEPPEVVHRWFADGLSGGYGRDASTGLGHLVPVAVHPCPPRQPLPGSNALMLLSPWIPVPGEPTRGFFVGDVKSGRVGGEFAIGELPQGGIVRQKRLVRRFLAGTVLFPEGSPPAWLGRNLQGVHPGCKSIRQYGLSLTLPFRFADPVPPGFSSNPPTPSAEVTV